MAKTDRSYKKILVTIFALSLSLFCIQLFLNYRMYIKYNSFQDALTGVVIEYFGAPGSDFLNRLMQQDENTELKGHTYISNYGYQNTREIMNRQNMIKGMVMPFAAILFCFFIFFMLLKKEISGYYKKVTVVQKCIDNLNNISLSCQLEHEGKIWEQMNQSLKQLNSRIHWDKAQHYLEKKRMFEFIENMTHQLKTPVAASSLYIENLQRKETDADKRRKLELCREQLETLNHFITDYLRSSRIEAQKEVFDYENHEVKQTIISVWKRVAVLAAHKKVTLQYTGSQDIEFYYDEKWMSEALENIIKNGIEHAESDSILTIAAEKFSKYLQIKIEDRGKLLRQEDTLKMFERFHTSSSSYSKGGTGIGLHMAKTIITAHYGNISVENTKKGVCFLIQLPILHGVDVFEH